MKIGIASACIMGRLLAFALVKEGHQVDLFEKNDQHDQSGCSMAAAGLLTPVAELEKIESGCKILMPGAAPIGSGKGLLNLYALEVLRARFPDIILIIDAGIGKPSHASQAMELGFDAVLLNTAISIAKDPVQMATAFSYAVKAGHLAYAAGMMAERKFASPSTPLVDTPFLA